MDRKPNIGQEMENLIERLSSSTHSPKGQFSAENSFHKLATHLPKALSKMRIIGYISSAAAIALIFIFTWSHYIDSQAIANITINTLAETKLIKLPDGTTIALNRYSSLTYPESFYGNKRIVTLKGEAYFEVAKDTNHPFVVETKDINIQVLGTHFNVDAYINSKTTKTTLLEGSVKVYNKQQTLQTILKPNECAIYNKNKGLICQQIGEQAKEEIAWRENKFIFTESSIGEIANELSQSFNTHIEIKNEKLRNYKVSARFENNETLKDILDLLQTAGYFKYSMINNQITLDTRTKLK